MVTLKHRGQPTSVFLRPSCARVSGRLQHCAHTHTHTPPLSRTLPHHTHTHTHTHPSLALTPTTHTPHLSGTHSNHPHTHTHTHTPHQYTQHTPLHTPQT